MGRRRPRYQPEEAPIFDAGDVVQLKSGGPPMTIWNLDPACMPGLWPWMYWCHWFDGSTLRDHKFPGHVLAKVEAEA